MVHGMEYLEGTHPQQCVPGICFGFSKMNLYSDVWSMYWCMVNLYSDVWSMYWCMVNQSIKYGVSGVQCVQCMHIASYRRFTTNVEHQ